MDSERTKLIAAVVILIAAGGAYFFLGGKPADFPTNHQLVCVATGKFYSLASDELRQFPEKNPDTGEYTLMPVTKRDGRYYVSARHSAPLADKLKDVNRCVDPKTLEVMSAGGGD